MSEFFPFLIAVCRRVVVRLAKPVCGLLGFLPVLLLSLSIEAGGRYEALRHLKGEKIEPCQRLARHLNRFGDEDIFLCELPNDVTSLDVEPLVWEELKWSEAKARSFMKKAQANIKKLATAFPPTLRRHGDSSKDVEKRRKSILSFIEKYYPEKFGNGEQEELYKQIRDWRNEQRITNTVDLSVLNLEFEYAFKLGSKAWSVRKLDATELPGFKELSADFPESQIILYGFFIHYPYCKIRRLNDRLVQSFPHLNRLENENLQFALQSPSVDGCPYLQFVAYEWRYHDKAGKAVMITDFIRRLNGMSQVGFESNLYHGDAWLESDLPPPEGDIYEVQNPRGWAPPFLINNQLYRYEVSSFGYRLHLGDLYKGYLFKLIRNERPVDKFFTRQDVREELEKFHRESKPKWSKWEYEKYNSPDAKISHGLIVERPSDLGWGPAVYELSRLRIKATKPADYIGKDFTDMPPVLSAQQEPVCDIRYFSDDERFGGRGTDE